MENKFVIAILLLISLLVGVLGTSMYFVANPKIERVSYPVPSEPKIIFQDKIVEKEVKVPVEVVKEVKVEDTTKLDLIQEYLQDIDEDLSIEYVVFEAQAKMDSESYISKNMISMLKEEDFFDSVLEDYRASEVSVYKIDDAEVLSEDFEDLDIELKYNVKVKAKESGEDREYFYFNVTIPFEDGKIVEDDIEVIEA